MWGFREGGGGFEFRALGGGGALSSLAERALMLRYRLPEGRSWKRLWEGWVGSFTMLLHCWASCKENVQDGGERGTDVRWRVLPMHYGSRTRQ